MAGRDPHEAFQNYLDPLQKSVSCVTVAVFDRRGDDRPLVVHPLTLNRGNAVRLTRAPKTPVFLRVTQHYRIVRATSRRGPWKVTTVAYFYALDDSDGREIIAYHWDPEGQTSPIKAPHMHLGHGARVGLPEVAETHIPTGRIALEEFLRLAIEAFGVRPRRRDWDTVLRRGQAAFEKWRTWPTSEGG